MGGLACHQEGAGGGQGPGVSPGKRQGGAQGARRGTRKAQGGGQGPDSQLWRAPWGGYTSASIPLKGSQLLFSVPMTVLYE